MKVMPYHEAAEEKVEDPEAKDVFIRVLIGPADGADRFHLRRFRVLTGGHTPLHQHDWEHEVFVLAGQGELETPDGLKPLKTGDAVFVPPGLRHQFKNAGKNDFEFLCLIPAPQPG